MQTNDFNYELPPNLIAQSPIDKRDGSKLLVYNQTTDTTHHKHFFDIIDYLQKGDILVVNNTKVIPARLYGKKDTGAICEVLLHKRQSVDKWECLCKPAKRLQLGTTIKFDANNQLCGKIIKVNDDGSRIIQFAYSGIFEEVLAQIGTIPLPHYIKDELKDINRYQTVYVDKGESVAAPTAGLHFTKQLLNQIEEKGIRIVPINLTVGLGTFRPVKSDNIVDHIMHSEYYTIPPQTAEIINQAKSQNHRIIAVGTTSVRAIESATDSNGIVQPKSENTQIFIYPPYQFKTITALITNFHLPKSTLLMLVSAFVTKEKILQLYNDAIQKNYRFFSFGDAMFIY